MSISDIHGRISSRVWKAIAQSELNLSQLTKEQQQSLVELVTNAAILEVDEELGRRTTDELAQSGLAAETGQDSAETVLWEGRPLLSISTRYFITNERIRIVEGILGKDREDIELIRVQDIDQSQSLGERLLGIGDIVVRSHDSSHPEVALRNIREPEQVHEILRRAVIAARKSHGLIFREEM